MSNANDAARKLKQATKVPFSVLAKEGISNAFNNELCLGY